MNKLYSFDQTFYEQYDYVIGLDEAGRGPMAGELVVAGVILGKDFNSDLINDSKQLSAKKREQLFEIITNGAVDYAIEIISVEEVDKLNVYQASKQGMLRCINQLMRSNTYVLTDAMPLEDIEHLSIIKGDATSLAIAAASILAKVTRDRLMIEHAKNYPGYLFEKHKGYVTKMHKERLKELGPCSIHRKSFKPVIDILNNLD